MRLVLVTLVCGDNALIVNNLVVATSEANCENPRYLTALAEKLASAAQVPLITQILPTPAAEGWLWEDVLKPCMAELCAKCGSEIINGFCADEACVYHTWDQRISLSDLDSMTVNQVSRKYGIVRAEAVTNDFLESQYVGFDASRYVLSVEDDVLLEILAEADLCSQTFSLDFKAIQRLFPMCQELLPFHDLPSSQYTVTVHTDSLLWLLCSERYGVWARSVCARHGHALSYREDAPYGGGTAAAPLLSLDEEAHDWVTAHRLNVAERAPAPLYLSNRSAADFPGSERTLVGPRAFNSDRGYTDDEIALLVSLAVGGKWESPDLGLSHTVTRIS